MDQVRLRLTAKQDVVAFPPERYLLQTSLASAQNSTILRPFHESTRV